MVAEAALVTISISIQDKAASVASFGIPLILAYHEVGPGVRTYAATPVGLAAMVTDGFTVNESSYRLASAIVAQSPVCSYFKVYPRSAPNDQDVTLTPTDTTEGFVYEFTVTNWAGTTTTVTYTNGAAETATTIATALQVLLDAITGVDAVDNTGSVTISPTTSGERFFLLGVPRELTFKDAATDAGIATDLAAAAVADLDWYGLVIDSHCETEILAAAAWCESNKKIHLATCLDSDIYDSGDSTDVVSQLRAASYNYTKCFATRDGKSHAGAALIGRQFSRDPGSSTWHAKTLSGVTVDNLTETEFANAKAKGALLYVPIAGINMTHEPYESGRYLDLTRGTDWLEANMAADVVTLFANSERIPYTNVGISEVENVVATRLGIAETQNGLIASGWVTAVPDVADVPTADKATRTLNNVTFDAVFQGAVHSVAITGTITV